MNREQTIEDMSRGEVCIVGNHHCANCADKCPTYYKMTTLYDRGYRKADEVVEVISQEVWDAFSRKISDEFGDAASDIDYITLSVEEVYNYLFDELLNRSKFEKR